jgi:hypothetical protein
MIETALERLAEAGIQLLPIELETHFMCERDGFVALVERRKEGFGAVGAAGLLTSTGLAPMVWRGTKAVFVSRRAAQDATPEQVETIRRFQSDLEAAIAD